MNLILLFSFVYGVRWCNGVRLNPLENNDKLQDISNRYVAEWQWESWPIKEDPSEREVRSPGARVNVALWKDSSGPTWYIFGGLPVDGKSQKIYSDVWKYSVTTRLWERVFPSQSEMKGASNAKIGGMMTLRANLFEEVQGENLNPNNCNVVLCGGITKTNTTKIKKQNIWNNFTRRKKQDEDKREEEPKSLAVYAPKASKSNTVWQIDLKDKLWTAYVCCWDTCNNEKTNSSLKSSKLPVDYGKIKNDTTSKITKINGNFTLEKNNSSIVTSKISKVEDDVENKQQHLNIEALKNKKKKINQSKKTLENLGKKAKEVEKRSGNYKEDLENGTKESKLKKEPKPALNQPIKSESNETDAKINNKINKETYNLKMKDNAKTNKTKVVEPSKNKTDGFEKLPKAKVASKYCPEFAEDGEPVTWCDGNNEVLITADISLPKITLWIFNLKTTHWSQQEVKVYDEINWPGCSNVDSVRYAGNEEEVYIVCSLPVKGDPIPMPGTQQEQIKPSKNPSEDNFTTKVVYRINYKHQNLESLGELQLSSYFESPEGVDVWRNDSKSILQIIQTPANETILLLAYLNSVDLWILSKDHQEKYFFDSIEKIWRGSALKWFNKYHAVFYNLQFITESGDFETVLIPNPRIISFDEYWPRERGRFIIRIFKNENLKNQSFDNRTREQNLTYKLLQSEYKPPGSNSEFDHAYSLKVFIFFGISLAIFTVFGFVIFLKKCVNCPPKMRPRNECHKSPLVIRYSVIPDDLLYPVA